MTGTGVGVFGSHCVFPSFSYRKPDTSGDPGDSWLSGGWTDRITALRLWTVMDTLRRHEGMPGGQCVGGQTTVSAEEPPAFTLSLKGIMASLAYERSTDSIVT